MICFHLYSRLDSFSCTVVTSLCVVILKVSRIFLCYKIELLDLSFTVLGRIPHVK